MKTFLLEYTANVVFALLILLVGGLFVEQIYGFYYRYAPIDAFYENRQFLALDVCEGDEHQSVLSERYLYGTELGYSAEVSKELLRIESGESIKVWEETTQPFVEVTTTGTVQRIQKLPTDLEAGIYKWVLYITLDVYGNDRQVIPPVESNLFNISNCNL